MYKLRHSSIDYLDILEEIYKPDAKQKGFSIKSMSQ